MFQRSSFASILGSSSSISEKPIDPSAEIATEPTKEENNPAIAYLNYILWAGRKHPAHSIEVAKGDKNHLRVGQKEAVDALRENPELFIKAFCEVTLYYEWVFKGLALNGVTESPDTLLHQRAKRLGELLEELIDDKKIELIQKLDTQIQAPDTSTSIYLRLMMLRSLGVIYKRGNEDINSIKDNVKKGTKFLKKQFGGGLSGEKSEFIFQVARNYAIHCGVEQPNGHEKLINYGSDEFSAKLHNSLLRGKDTKRALLWLPENYLRQEMSLGCIIDEVLTIALSDIQRDIAGKEYFEEREGEKTVALQSGNFEDDAWSNESDDEEIVVNKCKHFSIKGVYKTIEEFDVDQEEKASQGLSQASSFKFMDPISIEPTSSFFSGSEKAEQQTNIHTDDKTKHIIKT